MSDAFECRAKNVDLYGGRCQELSPLPRRDLKIRMLGNDEDEKLSMDEVYF